jgi:GNAT superfamily N-acetyltransferase
MTPVYRLATLADIPQLTELRILMQQEIHLPRRLEAGPEYVESLRSYFVEAIPAGSYVSFVAELEDRLVSATGLVVYLRPPSLGGASGRAGYVCNVYTRPEFRGRNLAGELMQKTVEYARFHGIDRMHLGATPLGRGIYERVGFTTPAFIPLELRA